MFTITVQPREEDAKKYSSYFYFNLRDFLEIFPNVIMYKSSSINTAYNLQSNKNPLAIRANGYRQYLYKTRAYYQEGSLSMVKRSLSTQFSSKQAQLIILEVFENKFELISKLFIDNPEALRIFSNKINIPYLSKRKPKVIKLFGKDLELIRKKMFVLLNKEKEILADWRSNKNSQSLFDKYYSLGFFVEGQQISRKVKK